ERGGVWSDWSHQPLAVGLMPPTVSPNISIAPLVSNVIPALDTSKGVSLQVPTGYATYQWQAVGGNTNLSTTNTLYTTTPGQYHVMVTQQFGCSSSFSNPYTVINAGGPNPPSAAAGLVATSISNTQIRLDWNVNPGQPFPQTGFEVYQASSAAGPYKIIAILGASATKDTATGLNPGATYYYKVRAVNNTAAAAASNVANSTTFADVQPPTAPTNLVVTGTTHTSVSLSWGAATDNVGVTEYDVYVNGKKVTSGLTTTTFTVYNLNYPASYNFVVTAKDFAGNQSPFSNQVTSEPLASGLFFNYYNLGTAPTTMPNYHDTLTEAKTGVSTSGPSLSPRTQSTNFGFLWQGYIHITTAGNYSFRTVSADGSQVWLGPLNGDASPYSFTATPIVNNNGLHTSPATVTSAAQALQVGTYPIAIAYFHGSSRFTTPSLTLSWTTPSSGTFTTIPSSQFADVSVNNGSAPAAPSNLVATAQTYSKIGLTWTDNSSNETGFEVWRSTNPTTGYATVGLAQPGTTSYVDSNLSASTQYFYELRAIGQFGQSAFSATSNATTLALPTAPAAPTNLVAEGTSTANSVTVSWTDNSVNEDNFQLYRSTPSNTNYLLIATLPANTTSYKDNGLFPSSVYYYKVRAVNIGGSSAYSNEDSGHTAVNAPTMAPITANQFMRFGTQLQLNVTASGGSGTLNLQVANLPAFGSFTQNGSGAGTITFNPQVTDQGIYNNITVTVTDANNLTSSQSFNLTVNNNFNPVIARPVNNVSVNEQQTAVINLSATDQNATDVLTWSFKGLPGFASTVINGGSAQLNLAPGYADGGSYTVQARVDDGNQGFDTVSFTITVVPVTPPTVKVYEHFADGSAGTVAGAPWNNTSALPTQNEVFANLLDQNGVNSGISLTITSAWQNLSFGNGTNTFGQTTGNNSGVYPDAVLGSAYYTVETPQTIRVSGLDTSTKYNFTFFGSRGNVNDDRTSVYSVTNNSGTSTVSLQAANNTTQTVSVNNVVPNPDGTVVITLARGANAPYGYMNSVVIEKQFNDHTAPARPRNIAGQFVNNNQVALTWIAAAYNANSYQVYRSTSAGGPYTLLNPGMNNPVQASYTDSTISQNNTYYYYVTATNAYGVSPTSDTVTMAIPNLPPVVTNIAPISVQAQKTASVNVSASDPGDVITLSASGLPGFASFTDNGNGQGTLSLAPATSDVGSYTGSIVATDNHGGSSSTPVSITVGSANLRNIYINMNDGSASEPAQGAPWNNMNSAPNAGAGIANLRDDSAALTGFGISLVDPWAGANNVGPTTGNNSGVYPDNVMQSLYYDASGSGSPRHINITGLSAKGKYNIKFYGGRGGVSDNRITHYSVGSQSVQLNAASNTSQTVELDGLSPDASGRIQILVAQDAGAAFAYLNALQIQYTFDTTFYAPTNLTASSPNSSTINLNWVNNAPGTTTSFEVWRATSPTGPWSLLTTVAGTTTSYSNTGLGAGSAFFYEVRGIAGARQSPFSNVASSSTVAYSVYVQMNDGSQNLPQGGIWNSINTLIFPGFVLPNMINGSMQATGINLGMITNFTGYNVFGVKTGNNSGIFPDNVMNGFFYMNFGDTAKMIVTGLDLTSTYNLNFFGSRANPATSVVSTYKVGNTVVSLDAANNSTRTVQVAGIKPDSTGSIFFSIYNSDGGRAYLNALVIDGVPSAAEAFGQTPVPTAVPRTGAGAAVTGAANALSLSGSTDPYMGPVRLMAYPNPFIDEIRLSVSLNKPVDKLNAMVIDVTGRVLHEEQLTGLPQGVTEQKLHLNAAALPAGTYFVILTGLPDGKTKAVPMVKQDKQ
ncbi:MAG: fibronectin type III domain-containing protein, partial [Bacteroidota bacterium]|nr:fibronectin type III domain-containing protein [Bacteroidota bacterium]